MSKGNFQGTTFKETGLTKAIAYKAKFDEADFTRAVADRVNFQQASLRDAIFDSTILTGSDFNGADVTGADFTDAIVSQFGIKDLCDRNPTVTGTNKKTGADTRSSLGCRGSPPPK